MKDDIAKLCILLNVYSSLIYTFPLNNLLSFFPSVSFSFIANIALLAFIICGGLTSKRISIVEWIVLISILSTMLITVLINIKEINIPVEINVFRGVLVIFFCFVLVSKYNLFSFLKRHFVLVSLFGGILVVLQIISIITYHSLFFGIEYGTYLSAAKGYSFSFRVSPLNGDPNYFAYTLLPGLLITLNRIFSSSVNKIDLFVFSFILFALIATISRGALLAFFFSAIYSLCYLVFFNKKHRTRSFIMIIVIAIFAVISFSFIQSEREGNANSSTNERLQIIDTQLAKVNDSPIFGDSFSGSKVSVNGRILGAHNLYLEIFRSYGVVFFAGFIFLIFHLFISSCGLNRTILIGYLIANLFLGLLIYQPFWMFTVLCLCLKYEKNNT
ncbi:hypothetical protein HR45_13775 [Shewanella mangrovi]|uniref:O-antigen ligase-related domain-containing protein n=1 Tax=Shewanella mangrovi TaxID=1515746 RepID=A0A094JWT2_9GAMM|nr:O-antigen ligase family protein [Shewanella mangrovi]KFZ36866.1 hypothetical protein HR45_13775 [Shewanella mangrovi]